MDVPDCWCLQWGCWRWGPIFQAKVTTDPPRSGAGEPHVLDQGSNAGTCPAPISSGRYLNHSQAYSPALPVGTQHYYKNSREALARIFRAEGFRGIFRGMDAAILRTSMGSSVQLPSYNWTKTQLVSRGILPADSPLTFIASSTISGVCVVRPVLPLLPPRLLRNPP